MEERVQKACSISELTGETGLKREAKETCIEQSCGLCGRGRGWDDLGEWY